MPRIIPTCIIAITATPSTEMSPTTASTITMAFRIHERSLTSVSIQSVRCHGLTRGTSSTGMGNPCFAGEREQQRGSSTRLMDRIISTINENTGAGLKRHMFSPSDSSPDARARRP